MRTRAVIVSGVFAALVAASCTVVPPPEAPPTSAPPSFESARRAVALRPGNLLSLDEQSFERSAGSWVANPNDNVTATRVKGASHDGGSYALRATATANGGYSVNTSTVAVPVGAAAIVDLECWVRTATGRAGHLFANWWNAQGFVGQSHGSWSPVASSWTRLGASLPVLEGASHAQLFVELSGAAKNETFTVDDCAALGRAGAAPPAAPPSTPPPTTAPPSSAPPTTAPPTTAPPTTAPPTTMPPTTMPPDDPIPPASSGFHAAWKPSAFVLQWGGWPFALTDAAGRSFIVMDQTMPTTFAPLVRAANPGTKVLLYVDLPETGGDNTAVPLAQAQANGWDTGVPAWPGTNILDLRIAGARAAAITNSLARVQYFGADGVFYDNAQGADEGRFPGYRSAMNTVLRDSRTQFNTRGLLVFGNLVAASWQDPSTFLQLGPLMDGVMEEFFTGGSSTSLGPPWSGADWWVLGGDWERQWQNARALERAGTTMLYRAGSDLAISASERTRHLDFAFASMLLASDGRSSFSAYPCQLCNSPGLGAYGVNVTALANRTWGTPLEDAVEVAPDTWRRRFTGGTVWVNGSYSARTVDGRNVPAGSAVVG